MEQSEFFVTLQEIIDELKLEVIHLPKDSEEIKVTSSDINRPGLQVAGFFDYFDNRRVQILGKVEYTYLNSLGEEERRKRLERLFETKIPAVVITRQLEIFPEMIEFSDKYCVSVLRSAQSTSYFMSSLIAYLNVQLAPRITRHGVLVEIYGEGVLMLGESGVGKSETAVELVKRGHRLVADDAVEIKKVSAKSLVGSAPSIIRHFIELRGIGIIDVKKIFGMGAVKDTEKIDLVINMEEWDEKKQYDRLGLETQKTNILGLEIDSLTIPVRPGRNLAVILEIAAMNNRQKRMGYNAAQALNERLMNEMKEK